MEKNDVSIFENKSEENRSDERKTGDTVNENTFPYTLGTSESARQIPRDSEDALLPIMSGSDYNDQIHVNHNKSVATKAPDGGYGWIVVAARLYVEFLVVGVPTSFGVIYLELIDYFQGSRADIAWVGSLSYGITHLIGPLSGWLADRYGCRYVTIAGSIIATAGFFSSFYAPSISFLYFTFGVATGTGFSLLIVPSVAISMRYFDKKQGLACGIATIGAACGTTVLPPVFKILMEYYGWRGLMFILAGFTLNATVCGSLYRDPPHLKIKSKILDNQEKTAQSEQKTPNFISILCNKTFIVYITATAMGYLGFGVPYVHLPDLATLHKIPKSQATALVSTLGIASALGRVIIGALSDRSCVNRLWLLPAAMFITGGSTMVCPLLEGYSPMMVYAVIAGASSGVFALLLPIVANDLIGLEQITSMLGFTLLFCGIAVTVASPIAGLLFDTTGNYQASFYFAGSVFVFGAVVLVSMTINNRCSRNKAVYQARELEVIPHQSDEILGLFTSTNDTESTRMGNMHLLG